MGLQGPKKNTNDEVVKYKGRIVARGFVQKQGNDFDDVFAPVTRLKTLHLLLALAAKSNREVHNLDVKLAFLNDELFEEIYVYQPEGFVKKWQEHKVYKLLKMLHGLRQALRAWNFRLNRYLKELGFEKCPRFNSWCLC